MKEKEYKRVTSEELFEGIKFCGEYGYVSRLLSEKDISDIRFARTERFGLEKLGCSFFASDGFVCANCVSIMAFAEKKQKAKLEFSG